MPVEARCLVVATLTSTHRSVCVLAQLLDAGLADIPESWESGMLSAAGMGQEEVSSLVRAVFAESELRRSVLARITA